MSTALKWKTLDPGIRGRDNNFVSLAILVTGGVCLVKEVVVLVVGVMATVI